MQYVLMYVLGRKKLEKSNEYYMKQALKQAKKAFEKEEVPVGAIIVKNNKIIARAYNQKEEKTDTTKHAEIMNSVHKNIALLSRNIDKATLRNELSSFNFLVDKTNDILFDFNRSWPLNKRTLVVIGHDIILDQENINPNPENFPSRSLIALKDYN